MKKQSAKRITKPQRPTQARAGLISTATAAQLLMIGPERLRQLVKSGWVRQVERDGFAVADAVQGYIRFLKDEQRVASRTASLARVQDARAREIELRTAREANALIETAEAIGFVDEALGVIKTEIYALPARVTGDMGMREQITAVLDDIFTRAADRFSAEAASLRATGTAGADVEEDAP